MPKYPFRQLTVDILTPRYVPLLQKCGPLEDISLNANLVRLLAKHGIPMRHHKTGTKITVEVITAYINMLKGVG